jgi:hypothetical protein
MTSSRPIKESVVNCRLKWCLSITGDRRDTVPIAAATAPHLKAVGNNRPSKADNHVHMDHQHDRIEKEEKVEYTFAFSLTVVSQFGEPVIVTSNHHVQTAFCVL